ncbi:NAD-dependent epimerase/dehydratase family protein [Deinococcus sp.]|uniref:NAD-dependent epimerase/dehydratase family protein n=1 Tax=Deinococcus sp. TaxID=47478 RepID=UPI003C7A9FC1
MKLALDSKIFVTGHNEIVGRSVVRHLQSLGYTNIVTRENHAPGGWEPAAVNAFFEEHLPDYVFLIPVSLSGDDRLTPATWLRHALLMTTSVIHASYLYEVDRLLCIDCDPTLFDEALQDPAHHDPVLGESQYLQAELIAESQRAREAAGTIMTELCDSYRTQYGCHFSSALAGGLYGPGLWLDAPRGNLVSALFRKVLRASDVGQNTVHLYGNGAAPCDLLYIDDLADACLFLIEQLSEAGTLVIRPSERHTLRQLADTVKAVTGYRGDFSFDGPEGESGAAEFRQHEWPGSLRLRVRDNISRDSLGEGGRLGQAGWFPETTLEGGFRKTYRWFQRHRMEALH